MERSQIKDKKRDNGMSKIILGISQQLSEKISQPSLLLLVWYTKIVFVKKSLSICNSFLVYYSNINDKATSHYINYETEIEMTYTFICFYKTHKSWDFLQTDLWHNLLILYFWNGFRVAVLNKNWYKFDISIDTGLWVRPISH